MRTITYIKNLRQCSLQMNVVYMYVKCHAWEMVIKRDILIQEIKVEKPIFKFSTLSFHLTFINVHYKLYFQREISFGYSMI